jgi:hypothetical protein
MPRLTGASVEALLAALPGVQDLPPEWLAALPVRAVDGGDCSALVLDSFLLPVELRLRCLLEPASAHHASVWPRCIAGEFHVVLRRPWHEVCLAALGRVALIARTLAWFTAVPPALLVDQLIARASQRTSVRHGFARDLPPR